MADEQESSGQEPALPETPPSKRGRSPFRRLVLFALFAATLPFTWGQTTSCEGGPTTFTGIDLLTKNPSNGITLAVLFSAPVVLGLSQHRLRNAVVRLLMELASAMFAALGTMYCFVNAVFSGGLNSSSGRAYPAPWIATLASLLVVFDACQGAVERIRDLLAERKRRRSIETNEETAHGSPEA